MPNLSGKHRVDYYATEIAEGRRYVEGHKLAQVREIGSIQYPTPAQQASIDRVGSDGWFWECECGATGRFTWQSPRVPLWQHARHALRYGRAEKVEES